MSNADVLASLRSSAAGAARAFLAAHPEALLTSGRRTLPEQAHAMAGRVVVNRKWIAATYRPSPAARAAQLWVTANPAADLAGLASGILAVLSAFPASELRRLSWHLDGDAFDVHPAPDSSQDMTLEVLVADQFARGGSAELLTHEGGAVVWHAQFSPLDP